MEKYTLIPEQLLYEGTISPRQLYDPGLLPEATVLLTHDAEYWEQLKTGTLGAKAFRKIGFPYSEQLIQRSLSIAQGTLHNAIFALQGQGATIALNGAGGTHHAFRDRGEGFCLLNDIAIATNYLLQNGWIQRALIVDLDVHQGNGTASIFQSEPAVFTFSLHCQTNYPLHKEKSDLDLGLPPGTGDTEYLAQLAATLPELMHQVQPDIVFYLAGVDILETDKLGHFRCSRQACRERDQLVIETCYRHQIPLTVSLGGGYSPHIRDIVEAHCNTFRVATAVYT